VWAYRHILGWEDDIFKFTPRSIDINDMRALHVPQMVRDALRNMGEPIAAADVLLLGVSYRRDVGDTRYSGSELILRRLTEMGADVRVHDPYVETWAEIEEAENGSEEIKGYSRFFDRQKNLNHLKIQPDMWEAMKGVKCIVIAVPHKQYLELDPERVAKAVGRPFAVIDCFCIFDDSTILRYLRLGCEVKGLGRGHIRRLKDSLR
jgi:UDP-N-acetyl-D-mannosaminuronate dehydrogenase